MLYQKYEPYVCVLGIVFILLLLWYFCRDAIPEENHVSYVPGQTVNAELPIPLKEENHEVCINPEPPKQEKTEKKAKRFVSKGEQECKRVMEEIYGVEFKSVRPTWLRNPETGCNLELDCYNEDLRLAVEYNGEQHYNWPNYTNQSFEQFIKQARRDIFKREMCDRRGVYLISVPYLIPISKIKEYIWKHLPADDNIL